MTEHCFIAQKREAPAYGDIDACQKVSIGLHDLTYNLAGKATTAAKVYVHMYVSVLRTHSSRN